MSWRYRTRRAASCGWWLAVALSGAGCAFGGLPEVAEIAGPSGPVPHRDASPLRVDDDSGASTGATATDAATDDAREKPGDAAPDSLPEAGELVTCAFVGQLVSFDLTKIVAGQASLAPTTKGPGVNAASLAIVGVTVAPTNGAMNATNWPMGGVDVTKYYSFSVTPPAGCRMTLTALTVDLKASSAGPAMAAMATSVDGYAALTSLAISSAGGSATVPLAGIRGVNGSVEIHVFGFNARSTVGTMRIENMLSLPGSLGPI